MYGIFVSERGGMRYARYLVDGIKTVETRGRNMLQALVGKRVAIVRTRHGSAPLVVGYVDIVRSTFCKAEDFDKFFDQHLVPPGSMYDCHGRGKWFYHVANAEACEPFPLPADAVRHGRSWCEF